MTTPEEAREIAESIKDRKDWYEFEPAARCPRASNALRDLANQIERLEAQRKELREALKAAVDCGMVPVTSAKEGGAAKFSRQVYVADMIRAALKATE